MPVFLLVFEFIGTTELMVIAVVALLIFGPRKLPEIGRTIGKSLAEFRRASEDFKRTWEYEVEMERSSASEPRAVQSDIVSQAALPESSTNGTDYAVGSIARGAEEEQQTTIARGAVNDSFSASETDDTPSAAASDESAETAAEETAAHGGKKDWL